MREMGMEIARIKAGRANMFQSELFRSAFAAVSKAEIELYSTDGAEGAARGAGIGAGLYTKESAFEGLELLESFSHENLRSSETAAYATAYEHWKDVLGRQLSVS